MIKIGIISDTHSYWDDKYIKYFSDCDEIWHAGDIGDIVIIDKLKKITKVRAVYGNIDNHIVRREYKEDNIFKIEGVNVWITHIGGNPYVYNKRVRSKLTYNVPDIFICGHSHICKVQHDKRLNMLYMNPGAAGKYGIHKVRTLLRFVIDSGKIKNLEVVELN